MIEVGLDLNSVRLTVDERRHARSGEAHAVVVKILAVNAPKPFATVLVAIGSQTRFKRTVSTLLRAGLIGPVEVVHRSDRGGGVGPVSRPALPRSVQRVKAAVGQVISVPITVITSPRCVAHDV